MSRALVAVSFAFLTCVSAGTFLLALNGGEWWEWPAAFVCAGQALSRLAVLVGGKASTTSQRRFGIAVTASYLAQSVAGLLAVLAAFIALQGAVRWLAIYAGASWCWGWGFMFLKAKRELLTRI